MLNTIIETLVYLGVGLSVMMIGYFLVDLVIPADFPAEIKNGNKAIGWVSAGIYMGLGFIIRSAIITIHLSDAEELLKGVGNTAVFSAIGIVAFVLAYFIVDIVNRKFNFNKELEAGNEAAGIMVFGIFVGIAFLVSGVIQ